MVPSVTFQVKQKLLQNINTRTASTRCSTQKQCTHKIGDPEKAPWHHNTTGSKKVIVRVSNRGVDKLFALCTTTKHERRRNYCCCCCLGCASP